MKFTLRAFITLCILNLCNGCVSQPDYSLGDIPKSPETETPPDEDKDWRALANERIDLHRKSNISFVIYDNNQRVKDAEIEVALTKHLFKFGAVVKSDLFQESPYKEVYRSTFLEYFNASGFTNGLKPKQRGKPLESYAEEAIQWFHENNIPLRGHALQWEGYKYFRPEMTAVYDDENLSDQEKGEQLIALSEVHFHHAIEKWDVIAWDVVNETIDNYDINELVPQNTFAHWFKLADELRKTYNRPDIKLYLNDYQVISAIQPHAVERPTKYRNNLDQMLQDGAPVEGIGFQSRIKKGFVDPETMYQRLRDFEKYNLPYQATEFEIRDDEAFYYTDAEKKQILNELLTVYFSHPNTEGIWHWTFCNDANNNHPYALFKYDGTPYPCGEEWIRLMEEDFNTKAVLKSDSNGEAMVRGFKGTYEINISYRFKSITVEATVDQDQTIEIHL